MTVVSQVAFFKSLSFQSFMLYKIHSPLVLKSNSDAKIATIDYSVMFLITLSLI